MKKRIPRLLAAGIVVLAFAAQDAQAAPVLAPPPPGGTSGPVIGFVGASEVGSDYTCTSGAWIGNNPTFAYQWRRNGAPIGGATRDNYVAAPADVGQLITCFVTATDNTGSGTAESDPESPSSAPATTGLTQFSAQVNWRNFPVIPVGANLKRDGTTVAAIAEAPVDGTGSRDADFSPQNAPADTRDAVEFTFNNLVPPITIDNLFGNWQSVTVPANGSDVVVSDCVDCQNVTVTVTRPAGPPSVFTLERDPEAFCSSFPSFPGFPSPPATGCDYSLRGQSVPGGSIQVGDVVKVKVSIRALGGAGRVDETQRAPLPGQALLPRCEANRTSGVVRCDNLTPSNSYQLIRRSGGTDEPGSVISAGAGTSITQQFNALKGGDVVVLKRSSDAACTTTAQDSCITLVHVHNLTAAVVNGVASGQCQSGQWLRDGLCRSGAYSNTTLPDVGVKRITSDDDLGGGATVLAVPDVVNTTPLNGESMAPRFKAYADAGDAGNSPIQLGITPRGGGAPVFQTTNVNNPSGVQVCAPTPATNACASGTPGLAEGRYDARWFLTSVHHGDSSAIDTLQLDTRFVVQQSAVGPTGPSGSNGTNGTNGSDGAVGPTGPNGSNGTNGTNGTNGAKGDPGAQGPQGPVGVQGPGGTVGPQGPAGPRGPAGRDARVTCKPKATKKKVKVTCTVRFVTAKSAKSVRARITRRGTLYASGRGIAHAGKVALHMKAVRKVRPGRYTLTVVVVDRHGRSVKTHAPITVG